MIYNLIKGILLVVVGVSAAFLFIYGVLALTMDEVINYAHMGAWVFILGVGAFAWLQMFFIRR